MSIKNKLFFVAILSFAGLYGCYKTNDQSQDELCNHRDDNLDGQVDEGFRDTNGDYYSVENCGNCGVDCAEVFPTAQEVACEEGDGHYSCAIVSCPGGTHLVGDSLCVENGSVLCLPCENHDDCAQAQPGAECINLAGGEKRCGTSCSGILQKCPDGFECHLEYCVPSSGSCGCTPEQANQTFGCWVASPNEKYSCQGEQLCDGEELSQCEPIHDEICDEEDNNCDGQIDEDFIVDGVYFTEEHCGGCNHPCAPLGPNTVAECVINNSATSCERNCISGFVDLDLLSINGCECERTDISWPPTALGGDMDCDGQLDDTSQFVFVAKAGNDSNPGTIASPVFTINRGLTIGASQNKTVLVSQGIFDEQVTLREGVSLFGGYRSDFGGRNLALFETTITYTGGLPGHPAVIAGDINISTELTGITVRGTDATVAGGGSTAMTLIDCGTELSIHEVIVYAGQGLDGTKGESSAQILAQSGIELTQLDGASGTGGQAGFAAQTKNCTNRWSNGGNGGPKVCPTNSINISGGNGGNSSCPDTGCAIGIPCGNGGCSDFMVGGQCDYAGVYASAVPNPVAQSGQGNGGGAAGNLTYDAPTTRSGSNFCDDNVTLLREGGDGGDGQSGRNGTGGIGCNQSGTLFNTQTGIWQSDGGSDGNAGTHGSGGGGGTQGNGYDALVGSTWDAVDHLGGAGGGGGSGGCGSPKATGGGGGGGSIGIAIIISNGNQGPTFKDVRVIPARAGDGGDGGIGAAGGAPGAGGVGGDGNFWCARIGGKGGNGGKGGDAGGGGGGCGGSISGFHVAANDPSAEFYLTDLANNNQVDSSPAPGTKGASGFSPGAPGGQGANGTSSAFRLFIL